MRRVLVLFAHPVLERSRVNKRLVAEIDGMENVFIHDLYEVYPTLDIDVRREQQLLLDHDVIV
ncbi:MAG: NAD(P)H-dependent oxidoreductase, partial [Kofleriaceae bacterium]